MISQVSTSILNRHDFGSQDMRTGVIPFGSSKGYGLTGKQKKRLNEAHINSGADELDANRVTAMADRAKAMVVRLFEDVAKFAKSPIERSNLIRALNQGISFGRERGMQLARSNFEFASQMPIRKETSDIPVLQSA